jgi:uncharacterized membrane protein YczE
MFFLGYVVQFSYDMLQLIFPEPSMVLRCGSFAFGFVSLCLGSSIYMTADLGVSTYDAIALIMAKKWKIGPFKYIRITTDVTCVIVGIVMFLLGEGKPSDIPAFVGVGTILTAFMMGPLIDFFNRKVAIPMLGKKV